LTVYRRPDPIPLPRADRGASFSLPRPIRDRADGLHQLVAKQLFIAIASGKLPAGSILPNEHDLSLKFGVSRTALREAIKALTSKGLVEARRRRGTKVLERARWNMLDADIVSWSRKVESSHRVTGQLWTAVVSTQPALAALAATRRDALRLSAAAIQMRDAGENVSERVIAFAKFHCEVAKASGNPFLTSLIATCFDNLLKEDVAALQDLAVEAEPAAAIALAELIASGRVVESEQLMRSFIRESRPEGGFSAQPRRSKANFPGMT
jgi:DNA-binding FadR family transcriptional regulator